MLKKQPLGKIRSYLDKGILAFVEAFGSQEENAGRKIDHSAVRRARRESKRTLWTSVWVVFIETRFWQISSKDSN